jgi:hypothetical protein
MTNRSPIVVGVDGSQSGLAAARYGAEMAQRRAAPLHLINAYIPPLYGRGPTGRFDPYVVLDTHPESERAMVLRALTDFVTGRAPTRRTHCRMSSRWTRCPASFVARQTLAEAMFGLACAQRT